MTDSPARSPAETADSPRRPRKRPVGRPRNAGVEQGNPREGILQAAAQLFNRQGFAGTSMSQIARKAGLNQSSIYYWFPSKEHLLDDLLVQHRTTLHFAEEIRDDDASVSARLYAVAFQDTMNLCSLPIDFYELEAAASSSRTCFEEFFDTYHHLGTVIRSLIEEGISREEFVRTDPWRVTLTMMVTDEGLQHRYHQGRLGHRMFNSDPANQVIECTKRSFAQLGADCALTGLIANLDSLDAIRTEAERRKWLKA